MFLYCVYTDSNTVVTGEYLLSMFHPHKKQENKEPSP